MGYNSENPLFEFDIYLERNFYDQLEDEFVPSKLYCFISVFRFAVYFTLWTFKED